MKKALFVSSFLLLTLAVLGRLLRFRARQPRTLVDWQSVISDKPYYTYSYSLRFL